MSMMRDVRQENYAFDCVSLGEVMLRFDPGDARIRTAREFRVYEGGGEYNVTRGLRKCFQQRTAVVTSLVDNEVGHLIEDLMMQGGVDTSFIVWVPDEGFEKHVRNGLNFVERGFGIRRGTSVSDRGNSAASQLKPGDIDWDSIFGKLKTRWFHTSGIFTSLSETTGALVLEAVQAAKRHDVIVSFDVNYRPSLWNRVGDRQHFLKLQEQIVSYVDVFIGLGLAIEKDQKVFQSLDEDVYRKRMSDVVEQYPNVKVVSTTVRKVLTSNQHEWSAMGLVNGQFYESMKFTKLPIFDRVGGGDGFASGLIYGLQTSDDFHVALNYGVIHGALTMSTPGDNSMVSFRDVLAILQGEAATIIR